MSSDVVSPEKSSIGGSTTGAVAGSQTPTVSGGGSGSEEGAGDKPGVGTSAITTTASNVSPSSSQFQRLKVTNDIQTGRFSKIVLCYSIINGVTVIH